MENKKVAGPHEELTYRIIGAAMAVHRRLGPGHRRLGPGHREGIYQRALAEELTSQGIPFEAEKSLPVCDGERLLGYYIPDFIVDDKVIVEIKAFATVHQEYLGQVITYLNHTGLPVGLLINFGERSLRPRRVFPSPQATELAHSHQWMFVPDRLKA